LLYVNDITKITNTKDDNNKSKLVLFCGWYSLNPTNFIKDINGAFTNINNFDIKY
jgi:hypothetical protein